MQVETEGDYYGWGVVINLRKRFRKDRFSASESFYIIDCLLSKKNKDGVDDRAGSSRFSAAPSANAEILPVRLDCVCGISAVRLMVPPDLRSVEARNNLFASIAKVPAKLGATSLPNLDPVADMHIKDAKFKEITEVRPHPTAPSLTLTHHPSTISPLIEAAKFIQLSHN